MRAILSAFLALARIDAEQVCVRAIKTFPQRDARLGNRDSARTAKGEKIFTDFVLFAGLWFMVYFKRSENTTAHENMRAGAMIRLDLCQAFVCPMDAILTIHANSLAHEIISNGEKFQAFSLIKKKVYAYSAGWAIPTSSMNSFFVSKAAKSLSFLA
jgi:hypothetical protein